MLMLIILFIFGKQIDFNDLKLVKPNVWAAQGILGFAPTQEEAYKYIQALYDYQMKSIPEISFSPLDIKDSKGRHWHNKDPSGGFFQHDGLLSFVAAKDQESLKKSYSTALQTFKTEYSRFASKSLQEGQSGVNSAEINSTLIGPVVFKGKEQAFFGTPGIKASGLHATPTEARFPQILVLGSYDIPARNPREMFSITAEIKPNHFFIVMVPVNWKEPVLRPQYMQVLTDDPNYDKAATGREEVSVNYFDGNSSQKLIIDWKVAPPQPPTNTPQNLEENLSLFIIKSTGTSQAQVQPIEESKNDGRIKPHFPKTGFSAYSLLVKAGVKSFYYWVPKHTEMILLKEFFTKEKKRSLEDLYNFIFKEIQPKQQSDQFIFDQITEIKKGTFKW